VITEILLIYIHLIEKMLSCEKHNMLWTIRPNGFLGSGKTCFYFHAHGDNINTVNPNLVQKLLRTENILNINIWNWVASLSMLSSQNFIVSHRSWFIFCTRQRIVNQVYIYFKERCGWSLDSSPVFVFKKVEDCSNLRKKGVSCNSQ